MTKKELVAFTKKISARIARGEISARPASESNRRRFKELLRQRGTGKREDRRMRA